MRIIRTLVLFGDLGRFQISEDKFTSSLNTIIQIQGDILILEPVTICCGMLYEKHEDFCYLFPERLHYEINNLQVEGDGCYRIQSHLIDKNHLSIKLSGNCSVILYETFLKNLSLKIVGSGSIKSLTHTRVDSFDANLIGDGKIKGFSIQSYGDISVLGSGKVIVSASRNCTLIERNEGGKIKIEKF